MSKGIFPLTKNGSAVDFSPTAPGIYTMLPIEDLEGMDGIAIQHAFTHMGGGTSIWAYLQTSLDQGSRWFDIAAHKFTNASLVKLFTITLGEIVDPAINPTDMQLATDNDPDAIIQGILGDRLQLKLVVAGTYSAGSLFSSRVNVF